MLLRYFLSPAGRISANRYRAFLLWYGLIIVPIFLIIFFSVLVLGVRNPKGLLHQASINSLFAAWMLYSLGCVWPLIAVTFRRFNDLGYRVKDYFFMVSPERSRRLGYELLFKPGVEDENTHGANPGSFET